MTQFILLRVLTAIRARDVWIALSNLYEIKTHKNSALAYEKQNQQLKYTPDSY